ncbi:OprD family outer membrane porin [Pseudomonas sp. NPDC089743]|uniref:OprD family outer membrane porin n=1 Tax=Pseudomonas sp. NPDC089743 TaxID=3364471 RepID=UPI0037FE0C8A
MSKLFTPFPLSGLNLKNRVVMAPMTRARAETTVPDELTVLYYQQRAGAGLIITEGVPVSMQGRGYLFNPGLYMQEQVEGWKRVNAAVHQAEGCIFAQLWHVGRVSHTSLQPSGEAPVSSSAKLAANSNAYAYDENHQPGPVQASKPRALSVAEIAGIKADFVRAAARAMEAGFDGIEIHGANGYLFEQFINPTVNDRTDDSASFVGGRYQNDSLSFTLYAGQLEDAWHQYYANTKYTYAIDPGRRLALDFNIYRTLDYGRSVAGPINNTSWSLSTAYATGAHTFSLTHQQINGDEPLDWIGFGTMGGTITIGNAVQYATFTEANERSWQLRYDYDFAALGIPGLSFIARYVRGDNMDNAHSTNPYYTARHIYDADKNNKHWERDFDIRYVIQSGPAKEMSFRLRQSTHRATGGYRYVDIDEMRLITELPINVF